MKIVPMSVSLVDHMGSDVSVANAARVSFAKESTFDENGVLRQGDAKLIAFLARENHWSPFAHAFVSLRIKAPIFVLRQLGKHQVGLSWNEVSRRYVDFEPEFYMPEIWRGKAANVKQGSTDGEFQHPDFIGSAELNRSIKENVLSEVLEAYSQLIEAGICAEQARMVLPQNMQSEFIWSGSLMAFARVCNLRLDPHAQKECRDVAQMIEALIAPLFPASWTALVKTPEAPQVAPVAAPVAPAKPKRKSTPTVLTPAILAKIKTLKQRGYGPKEVGELLDISQTSAHRGLSQVA